MLQRAEHRLCAAGVQNSFYRYRIPSGGVGPSGSLHHGDALSFTQVIEVHSQLQLRIPPVGLRLLYVDIVECFFVKGTELGLTEPTTKGKSLYLFAMQLKACRKNCLNGSHGILASCGRSRAQVQSRARNRLRFRVQLLFTATVRYSQRVVSEYSSTSLGIQLPGNLLHWLQHLTKMPT